MWYFLEWVCGEAVKTHVVAEEHAAVIGTADSGTTTEARGGTAVAVQAHEVIKALRTGQVRLGNVVAHLVADDLCFRQSRYLPVSRDQAV